MNFKSNLSAAILALALPLSAQAGILAEEFFDYPLNNGATPPVATQIKSLAGGTGWTTPYSATASSSFIVTDNLAFTGTNAITSAGQALLMAGNSQDMNTGRSWGADVQPPVGTYYYSFLLRPVTDATAANLGRGTFMIMRATTSNTNGQNGFGIRLDNSSGTQTLKAWSPQQTAGTNIAVTAGTIYFVTGKIAVAADGTVTNSVSAFAPAAGVPLTEPTSYASTTSGSGTTNGAAGVRRTISGRTFSGTNVGFVVDELRIGSTYTDVSTATLAAPPAILAEPTSASFYVGQTATLTVANSGSAPLTYEWRKVTGVDRLVNFTVVGSSSATLSLANAQLTDTGTYYCFISNSQGNATSANATLTLVSPTPASITTQPTAATVNAGATASLTVVAAGDPAPTYQWQKNTGPDAATFTNVSGATSATLNIANTDFLAEGDYRCVVSYSVPGVSGSSTTTNTNTVTVTALIDTSEGDTDNDGMADSLEKYLRSLGFVVGVSNTAKVQSLINSGYTVSYTGTPTTSEINELALTPTTITRLPSGQIELSFGLKEAATPTSTFTTKALTTGDVSVSGGKIILSVGDGFTNTDFYRVSTETK